MRAVGEDLKAATYGSLDILTRRRGLRRTINGETFRFPSRWARYYPDPYEADKFRFLTAHCHPGGLAIDVGAHIGLFTVLMGRRVGLSGHVLSFEPTPSLGAVLSETVRLNGLTKTVEVRPEAVAGASGNTTLHASPSPGSNRNSLISDSTCTQQLDIKTVSLDDVLDGEMRRVDCIKIDAEGAELWILDGAMAAIRAARPALTIEIHPAVLRRSMSEPGEAWQRLDELGMEIFHGSERVGENWFQEQAGPFEVTALPRGWS